MNIVRNECFSVSADGLVEVLSKIITRLQHKFYKKDIIDDVDTTCYLKTLFEEVEENIENYFPIRASTDSITALKARFLNQKRIIRNQRYYKFKDITDSILFSKPINHCEIQYVCEIMDNMQEADFSNIILGRNLSIGYPELSKTRWPYVMWILSCQLTFRTQHDTFQQAVVIFDQYMLRNELLDRDSYLKLAIVSFFIACKMEEIEMPDIEYLLKLVGKKKAFTAESIYELEIEVLKSIDYGVLIHAPVKYLQIIVMLYKDSEKFPVIYEFSKVLIDLCVLHPDLSCYPSCFIAATAYCVSQYMIGGCQLSASLWSNQQVFLTGILWTDVAWMCLRLQKLIHNEFQDIWNFLNEKVSVKTLRTYSWLYLKEMCNPARVPE